MSRDGCKQPPGPKRNPQISTYAAKNAKNAPTTKAATPIHQSHHPSRRRRVQASALAGSAGQGRDLACHCQSPEASSIPPANAKTKSLVGTEPGDARHGLDETGHDRPHSDTDQQSRKGAADQRRDGGEERKRCRKNAWRADIAIERGHIASRSTETMA